MEFQLAYLKSPEQVIVQAFSDKDFSLSSKVMSLQELKENPPQIFLYPQSLEENPDFYQFKEEEERFYIFEEAERTGISGGTLNNLSYEEALGLVKNVSSRWLLIHNLNLLQEIFKVSAHLKELWKEDYSSFFQELWFLLKKNLSAKDCRLIFHDIADSSLDPEKEVKRELMLSVAVGTRFPEIQPGQEVDQLLMQKYVDYSDASFEICEYNETKGELVARAQVNQTPFLIMARVVQLNKLQQCLLKALFEGIQG